MPPIKQRVVLDALYAPENDEAYWDETLLAPLMQDALREELGPELSAIMDALLGREMFPKGPTAAQGGQDTEHEGSGTQAVHEFDVSIGWDAQPASMSVNQRQLMMRLTPEQQARLPELYDKLRELQEAYSGAGRVIARVEASEAAAAERRKTQKLRRRTRAKRNAVPAPAGESEEGEAEGPGDEGVLDRAQAGLLANRSQAPTQALVNTVEDPPALSRGAPTTISQHGEQGHNASGFSGAAQQGLQPEVGLGGGEAARLEHIQRVLERKWPGATTTGGSDGGHGGGAGRKGAGAGGSLREAALGAGLSPQIAALVERLDAVHSRYNPHTGTGWQEEGHLGSPAMQCLKRAALTLATVASLNDDAALAEAGVNAEDVALHTEAALADLQALLADDRRHGEQAEEGEEEEEGSWPAADPALRASLLYLRTQLLQPLSHDQQEAVAGARGVGSSTRQQRPAQAFDPEDMSHNATLVLPVEETTMKRLLDVIAGSEAWEALHDLGESWGQTAGLHQGGGPLGNVLRDVVPGGRGAVRWWARRLGQPSLEEQSLEMLEQLGRGADTPWDWSRSPAADPSPSEDDLQPNEELIQAMASLDTGALRCIKELEASQYSDEALMKWSLHPVVGPRIMSGQPILDPSTVHPMFQDALVQASTWVAEGVDFQVQAKRAQAKGAQRAQRTTHGASRPSRTGGRPSPRRLLSKLQRKRKGSKTGEADA